MKDLLKQTFGSIINAPKDDPLAIEHKQLINEISTLKTRYERAGFAKLLDEFHTNADLEHMIAQLKGEQSTTTSAVTPVHHVLNERRKLAELLFQSVNDIEFSQIITTMAMLCRLQEDKNSCIPSEPIVADANKNTSNLPLLTNIRKVAKTDTAIFKVVETGNVMSEPAQTAGNEDINNVDFAKPANKR